MIINRNRNRIEKLTGSQDLCLETVNTEKLTMKAKIIHKNCSNKKTNYLSIADQIGPMIGFLALGEKNPRPARSEEHTSELQSRFDLVCRLLLEKKNTT